MKALKDSLKKHAFNQDALYADILVKANREGLRSSNERGNTMMKRKGLIGLAFALVLALSVWALYPKTLTPTTPSIAAIISIDINPSFELSTSESGIVLEIAALNEDAVSITTDDLINQSVDAVIDTLILRSAEAGFINLEDLEEDFVLITTVSLEDNEVTQDELQMIIDEKIADSDGLQSVNVVQIKAAQREYFEAQGKAIPMGLYVINGMIEQGDGYMSVKEFFASEERLQLVKNEYQVTGVSQAKLATRIEVALKKLENAGEDTTELRERLNNAGEDDLLKIQSELRVNPNENAGLGENKSEDASGPNTDSNKPEDSGSSNSNQEATGGEGTSGDNETNGNNDTGTPNANQGTTGGEGGSNSDSSSGNKDSDSNGSSNQPSNGRRP